jgi:hypothetical protein
MGTEILSRHAGRINLTLPGDRPRSIIFYDTPETGTYRAEVESEIAEHLLQIKGDYWLPGMGRLPNFDLGVQDALRDVNVREEVLDVALQVQESLQGESLQGAPEGLPRIMSDAEAQTAFEQAAQNNSAALNDLATGPGPGPLLPTTEISEGGKTEGDEAGPGGASMTLPSTFTSEQYDALKNVDELTAALEQITDRGLVMTLIAHETQAKNRGSWLKPLNAREQALKGDA